MSGRERLAWRPRRVWRAATHRLISAIQPFRGSCLPDFLIVGARSAGTTSLYAYLSQHPQIIPAVTKEVHFFNYQYREGALWYRSYFAGRADLARRRRQTGKRVITGEASPDYLSHPLCASRIRAMIPQVRIVILLRDPVARAYSHYRQQVTAGRETLSFEDAIAQEKQPLWGEVLKVASDPNYYSLMLRRYSYLDKSMYSEQVRVYLSHFNPSQIMIVRSEDMFADPQEVCDSIAFFLGIDSCRMTDPSPRNVGTPANGPIPGEEDLRAYFKPFNERLYQLIGRDMGW